MKQKQSKLIMGTAIGLAALAVAIDHTRHTLPTPEPRYQSGAGGYMDETPCSMENPCSMDMDSPCSLDLGEESPCGLD